MEKGVDVISVKALAFKRFLEIAKLLGLQTDVVTDNDGDVAALEKRYTDYLGGGNIYIRYDKDHAYPTLEPQMLKANNLALMNRILGTKYENDADLINYMTRPANKTDVALRIFETGEALAFPGYINDAVK